MSDNDSQNNNLTINKANDIVSLVGTVGGWVVSTIIVTIAIYGWILSSGEDKYYSKIKGEILERKVDELSLTLKELNFNDKEMLKILYQLKGYQDANAANSEKSKSRRNR